jgi:hypothetical protein
VGDFIFACYDLSCEELTESGWSLLDFALHNSRKEHTSAVIYGQLLLVGGSESPDTQEWSFYAAEPFALTPGRQAHCSIQLSDGMFILTGGRGTGNLVTKNYHTDEVLPALNEEREHHACGKYFGPKGKEVTLASVVNVIVIV